MYSIRRSSIMLQSILIIAAFCFFSQTALGMELTRSPDMAQSNDVVFITAGDEFANACYSLENFDWILDGNEIRINIDFRAVSGDGIVCATVITWAGGTAEVGPLAPGDYDIAVEAWMNVYEITGDQPISIVQRYHYGSISADFEVVESQTELQELQVSYNPDLPQSNDVVTITAGDDFPNACFSLEEFDWVLDGNEIRIEMNVRAVSGDGVYCASAITWVGGIAEVGPLTPGVFHIAVEVWVNVYEIVEQQPIELIRRYYYGNSFTNLIVVEVQTAPYVTIVNPSFEYDIPDETWSPSPEKGDWVNGLISGWTIIEPVAGTWRPTTVPYPDGVPDGLNIAYSNDATISQILTESLTEGNTYTLQTYVGNRADGSFSSYAVQLLAGGNLLTQDNSTLSPARGEFFAFNSVLLCPPW